MKRELLDLLREIVNALDTPCDYRDVKACRKKLAALELALEEDSKEATT